MKTIRASVLGFCMGVRRAVDAAEKALAENTDSRQIFTLGPLIHNPVVMDSLEERGVRVLAGDDFGLVDSNSTVIIRAHGTTREILARLERTGAQVINATCPRVVVSQKRAFDYSSMGYTIVLAGDRNHGEVVSISSFAEGNCLIIESALEAMELDLPEKTVLMAQTTFSMEEYEKIQVILREKNPDIVVFNSICSATKERQNALRELGGKADGIIVAGGSSSANTRRLYETACTICTRCAFVEKPSDIPEEFRNLETVAITAGASTPDSVIEEIEKSLMTGKN